MIVVYIYDSLLYSSGAATSPNANLRLGRARIRLTLHDLIAQS